MPRRFGFGLGFNLIRSLGGAPSVPSGFVARFLSSLGWSLVTGDNIEQWDDQSANNNDLTQSISANQPTLLEYDVVKQSTLANMPTLVDTGANGLGFALEGSKHWGDLSQFTGSFTFSFECVANGALIPFSRGNASASSGVQFVDGTVRVINNSAIITSFSNVTNDGQKHKYTIDIDGSNFCTVYEDDIAIDVAKDLGETFNLFKIGRSSGSGNAGTFFNFKGYLTNVSDPTNITETPDLELLPQASLMRNDSNATPNTGDSISAWLSTTHKPYQNEIVFDGVDDYMTGLPPQAGDFTYVWRGEHSALSTTDYAFSSTSTPSAFVWLSDNILYLRDTTGANDIGLTNYTLESGKHVFVLVREGNDIRFYVDSVLKQTVDVTGRTYTIDSVGDSADSLSGGWGEFVVYNKALTQDGINYWSYLRNEAGELTKIDGQYIVIS